MASPTADWAWKQWRARYGMEPAWDGKQWNHLERLVKLLGVDFRGTWTAYLGDRSEFFRGHPPSKLAANVDQFRVVAVLPDEPEMFREHPNNSEYWTPERIRAARERARAVEKEAKDAFDEAERRKNEHQRRVKEAMLASMPDNRKAAREALKALRGSVDKHGEVVK